MHQRLAIENMFLNLNLLLHNLILKLTKNGCINFLMSETGISAPTTPSKLAIRVYQIMRKIKRDYLIYQISK